MAIYPQFFLLEQKCIHFHRLQKIEFDLNVLIGFDQDAEKWWAKN